jgi:hypothetical protein
VEYQGRGLTGDANSLRGEAMEPRRYQCSFASCQEVGSPATALALGTLVV